jgi:hypothetical protein
MFDLGSPGLANMDATLTQKFGGDKQHPRNDAGRFKNKLSPVDSKSRLRTHIALLSSETDK